MIWNKKAGAAAPDPSPEVAEHQAHCSALCCASRGDCVMVRFLVGNAAEATRLREMGLCEGARVEVLRHGNPLVVRVADSRVGLAHAVAERVLVEPEALAAASEPARSAALS